MNVTDVRIKLAEPLLAEKRLLAFASITFDDSFCIREMRVIDDGERHFVAMPSRRITDHCVCGGKNHLTANYCNYCGVKLEKPIVFPQKIFSDICFPINTEMRQHVEYAVLNEFEAVKRGVLP